MRSQGRISLSVFLYKEAGVAIIVQNPGALTSVQDAGRFGFMKAGIGPGGVMDTESYRAANELVGNESGEAVLEMTLMGPTLTFTEDTVFALTGAEMDAKLSGTVIGRGVAVTAKAGQELSLSLVRHGVRAYLAIRGGIDVPLVLGSRSTNFKCKMGGFEGRALKAGDVLPVGDDTKCSQDQTILKDQSTSRDQKILKIKSSQYRVRDYAQDITVRVVPGPQEELFSEQGRKTFYETAYRVTADSDRMGMRLDGSPIEATAGVDIVSDGIVFGSVQVPRSGLPIILMADHQTTGGYAKIGTVCSFDLPKLAQLQTGAVIHFKRISIEEAQELYCHPAKRDRDTTFTLGGASCRSEDKPDRGTRLYGRIVGNNRVYAGGWSREGRYTW